MNDLPSSSDDCDPFFSKARSPEASSEGKANFEKVPPLAEAAASAVRALKEGAFTLATAESCTGGLIAESVTRIPGVSGVFGYGWVTYANEAKQSQLGVPASVLEQSGAVSRETVEAMAEGARRCADADIAVAVSGIAGPGGGTPGKPVGTVWLAWAARGVPVETLCLHRPMPRQAFREMVAAVALRGVAERVKRMCGRDM